LWHFSERFPGIFPDLQGSENHVKVGAFQALDEVSGLKAEISG